ncbi:MAG: Fic family protein [Vampirovibrionales bacterium]|nr:Fic family protein [Vampirovibrionales bacterium]
MIKELRDLQSRIAEKCAIIGVSEQSELEYFHHNAFISTIGASTRIENAVLTDQEIDWVDTILTEEGKTTAFEAKKTYIFNKLSKDKERSIEEVVGCREILTTVYLQAKELLPLKEITIRGLHHDLLRYYPDAIEYAGGYKTAPNKVVSKNHETGETRTVLDPAAPGIETETAMADLVDWYNRTYRDHPWPLLIATEFVFRFLAIHPFKDGNGRLGRALFLMSLLQADDTYLRRVIPYISLDRHIEQNRGTYYTVLRQCSDGKFQSDPSLYKLEHLAWFFIKMMDAALTDIDVYRKKYALYKGLPDSHLAVLNVFKNSPEKRLQLATIETEVDLNKRTVQRALTVLLEGGFIQVRGKGPARKYQLVF